MICSLDSGGAFDVRFGVESRCLTIEIACTEPCIFQNKTWLLKYLCCIQTFGLIGCFYNTFGLC